MDEGALAASRAAELKPNAPLKFGRNGETLDRCLYSAPRINECLPRDQLKLSANWYTLPIRPCGRLVAGPIESSVWPLSTGRVMLVIAEPISNGPGMQPGLEALQPPPNSTPI